MTDRNHKVVVTSEINLQKVTKKVKKKTVEEGKIVDITKKMGREGRGFST